MSILNNLMSRQLSLVFRTIFPTSPIIRVFSIKIRCKRENIKTVYSGIYQSLPKLSLDCKFKNFKAVFKKLDIAILFRLQLKSSIVFCQIHYNIQTPRTYLMLVRVKVCRQWCLIYKAKFFFGI